MKTHIKTLLTLTFLGSMYSNIAIAKGTADIPPPAEQTQAVEAPSAADGILRLTTSFGPASLSVGSDNYTVGGASDIAIEYRFTENSLGATGLWVSFRYLPLGSAVELEGEEYAGVMNGLFIGVTADYALPSENWLAYAAVEAGGYGPDFDDELELIDADGPKDFQAGVQLSGGANYIFDKKFTLGPKLVIGLGSFTSYALTANAVFTF